MYISLALLLAVQLTIRGEAQLSWLSLIDNDGSRLIVLGAVYMGGGTGRLRPGRDVFYPGFKNCLCGRRDGMFAGTGRFSSRVYMRMFLPGAISPGTICKVSIISSRQSGTECLYDKNCPALAGILVERIGIPLGRDGTKNVPANIFSI